MNAEALQTLAKTNRWSDLEKAWMTAIERATAEGGCATAPRALIPVIDMAVKAGQNALADTLGWAWLALLKENRPADEALQVGRELLVHLTDGDQLREEILDLYQRTHNRDDLQRWIERSGLKTGKSVRRALRFLDVGLELAEGRYLIHRTDDQAARIVTIDFAADEVEIKLARRSEVLTIGKLIDEYDVADENDFRILQQLRPDHIAKLALEDPAGLAIGILKCQNNKIVRESLKLLLSKYLPAEAWSGVWDKIKAATKKSPNLRIEGRSTVFLIYDPVGQTPEDEAQAAFSKAKSPRELLETLENYLKSVKEQKAKPDTTFLNKVQDALVNHITRFTKHKEPAQAFATALVIERLAADGLPISTDAHGVALKMIGEAADPVAMVTKVPDARLWSLAVACLEQAYPKKWPEYFAELILYAPASQCDALAKRVEKAGRGELLAPIAQQALEEPGRFTDALMWLWRDPEVERDLHLPSGLELFNIVMALVGPVRTSEGKAAGQSALEMRAKVRSGLSHKDYARFRGCIEDLDDSMVQTVRRSVERAEGLGPTLQDEMSRILRTRFPNLYLKPKVAMWDDDSVYYYSSAGLKTKEDELVEIVNVKMRENAKAIGEAAAHGDLSENSEYKFALEERDLLRARVANLNREIAMAKVLEPREIPQDYVSIGQRITLRPTQGSSMTLTILGYDESDITHHVYSYHSPMAREMLGKKPGEPVTLNLDEGPKTFTIEKIESAIE